MEPIKRFDKRAFTSILLLISAVILPLSIFMRHWPMFEKSNQAEHILTSIHATTGFVFTILLIMHMVFNRKALKKYLFASEGSHQKKNVFAAVIFVVFVILILSAL